MISLHDHKSDEEVAKCPICQTLDKLGKMIDLGELPCSIILVTATDDLVGVGFQGSGHLGSVIRTKLVLLRILEAMQAQEAAIEHAAREQYLQAQIEEGKQHLKN